MKKVKLLTVGAFLFAIGSAFAPRAIESVKHRPYVTSFVPTVPCTATKDCPDNGSVLCGYKQVGCTARINKP